MQEDWKALIAKIAYWKQIANDNDDLAALPWHLPKIAASEGDIQLAEDRIGVRLSASYRNFLTRANGWQGFFVLTNLFGTDTLTENLRREILIRPDVAEYISESDIDERCIVPIGASDADRDVFLLVSEDSQKCSGEVIWLAGAEVERFSDFRSFFEAMINYNARLAQQLTAQKQKN